MRDARSEPTDDRESERRGAPAAPAFVVDPDGRVLWSSGARSEDTASGYGPQSFSPPPSTQAPEPAIARRTRLALLLFLATCATTTWVGGPIYALGLMVILSAHEMGHFLAARAYGVPTSWPYFLPMPLPPLGTLGAVLTMRPRSADARGLFDIAVAGPIAGLVPTLAFILWGSALSEVVPADGPSDVGFLTLGQPALYRWLSRLVIEVPEGSMLLLHPLGFAGWVGLLVTAINLLPIGQLDGGHVLYTLTPRWAHRIARLLMAAWIGVVIYRGLWGWSVMILLLLFFGVRHPPVRSGGRTLGAARRAVGAALLALLPLSITLEPLRLDWDAIESSEAAEGLEDSGDEVPARPEPSPPPNSTRPLDPTQPFA